MLQAIINVFTLYEETCRARKHVVRGQEEVEEFTYIQQNVGRQEGQLSVEPP